ncbi:unnamed protein product [Linum trigynum]|uniref:Uncharacterized protein n=1 Tax=Linum trigynum TaxID=586398 RepID=A0AAV2DRL8_9ROSI
MGGWGGFYREDHRAFTVLVHDGEAIPAIHMGGELRGSMTWLGLRRQIWEKNQNPRLTASDGDSEVREWRGSMMWTGRAITAFVQNSEVPARVHVSDTRHFTVLHHSGEAFTVLDKSGDGFPAFVKNGEHFTIFVCSGDDIHCLGPQR